MTGFNAIMHQITALPQILKLDFTGLLLTGGRREDGKRMGGGKDRE